MAIRKDNSERNKPTKEEYDKIPETEFREAFKKYLSDQGAIATDGVDDGVDVVAMVDGKKRYFELKTSSTNVRGKAKYFGALSQVEWECAFANPEHFYLVLIWNEGTKETGRAFRYAFYQLPQLYEFATLAPYTTYLNIEFDAVDKKVFDLTHNDRLELPPTCKKKLTKSEEEDREILIELGHYYHKLRLKKKYLRCKKEKKDEHVLLLIPAGKYAKYKKEGIPTDEKFYVLKYDEESQLFSELNVSEKGYYMVVAFSEKIVDVVNGRGSVRVFKRPTKYNTWVMYYHVQ